MRPFFAINEIVFLESMGLFLSSHFLFFVTEENLCFVVNDSTLNMNYSIVVRKGRALALMMNNSCPSSSSLSG